MGMGIGMVGGGNTTVALDNTATKYKLCTWDKTTKGLFVAVALIPCLPPVFITSEKGQGCISNDCNGFVLCEGKTRLTFVDTPRVRVTDR